MGWVSSIVNSVASAVKKAWDTVKGVASAVGNYVSGVVSNVVSGVSGVASSVGSYVSGAVKKVSSAVSNTISSITASMNSYYSTSGEKYYNLTTQAEEAEEARRYDKAASPFVEAWDKLKSSISAGMIGQAALDFIALLAAPISENLKMGTVPIGPAGPATMIKSPSGAIVGTKWLSSTEAAAKAASTSKLASIIGGVLSTKALKIAGLGIVSIFAVTEIPNLINMTQFVKKWKAEQRGESLTNVTMSMNRLEKSFESLGYAFRDALEKNDKEAALAAYKAMESLVIEYTGLINSKAEVLKAAGEYEMTLSLLNSFEVVLNKMSTEILNMGLTVKEAYPEFFKGKKETACPKAGETSASNLSYNLDQLHDFFGDLEWGIKAALEEKNYNSARKVIENMHTIKGAYDKILRDFKDVLQTAGIYDGKIAISSVMGGVISRYEEKIPVEPDKLSEETIMTIREIVDGDTVRSHYKNYTYDIRLVGINAPELAHTVDGAYRSAETGSKESRDWLAGKIWGQDVTVKIDPNNPVDKYGRVLGTIFFGETNINLESLKQGWSMYYPYDVNKYVDGLVYEAAAKAARETKKGVWGLMQGVGKLTVTSSPNYAEVFIDDIDTMQLTSATFSDIIVGKHTIYVIKYEWISNTVEIEVEAGKSYDVRFEK